MTPLTDVCQIYFIDLYYIRIIDIILATYFSHLYSNLKNGDWYMLFYVINRTTVYSNRPNE